MIGVEIDDNFALSRSELNPEKDQSDTDHDEWNCHQHLIFENP
jgi:hypothetical protein